MPRRPIRTRRSLGAASRSPATPGAQAAWLLGLLGLAPFFLAGAVLWAGPGRLGPAVYLAPLALMAYAATIVSFLGGVRWGYELARPAGPDPRLLIASVLPQIAAWALLFAPLAAEVRFGGLLVLLLIQGGADMLADDLPGWYRALRGPLTAGAAAALLSGLVWTLRLRHGG